MALIEFGKDLNVIGFSPNIESGWQQEVDGNWYYYVDYGRAYQWLELPEGRYYLGETGARVTGLNLINVKLPLISLHNPLYPCISL